MGVIVKNGIWYCGGGGSGGGGGGKITSTFKIESTTLYNGATRDFPVTLSDSINNYDLIKITFGWQAPLNDGSYSLCEPIYQTPDKLKENTLFTFWDYYYIYFAITDKTFSSIQANLNVGCLYQIEGLKFIVDSVGGGASESTSFEPVLLWEEAGDNSAGQTLTMNQSIDNFDAIMIEGCLYLNGKQEQYENRLIFKNSYYNKSQAEENWGLILYNGTVSSFDSKRRVIGSFIDNKTLYIAEAYDAKLTKIYGLKFSSNSFSGESFKTSKLFTSHWAGKSEEKYALSESYNKYDALQILYGPKISQEEDGKNRNSVFILTSNLTEGILDIGGFKERYVILQFFEDDKTHFKIIANGGVGETNTEYGVLSITGIKFGGSLSGGDSTEGLTDEQLTALANETIAAAWPL